MAESLSLGNNRRHTCFRALPDRVAVPAIKRLSKDTTIAGARQKSETFTVRKASKFA